MVGRRVFTPLCECDLRQAKLVDNYSEKSIEIHCISFNLQENTMAATTTMIHVRVDENIKVQAAETLASMGLTLSDAIRVFLTRIVADQELPFAIKAPNATSKIAIAEAAEIVKKRRARFANAADLIDDIEKASSK